MDLLQVVAEPRRQAILKMVWTEERSAGDIARAFNVTFGAVSQHLQVLNRAGLVDVRREGKHRYYRANRAALGPLARFLTGQWRSSLSSLKTLAEVAERRARDLP